MSWTWLGIAAAVFLALCCFTGYRRGFIKEIVSTFFVVLSIALVWVVNPYVNEFIRENTSVYEKAQQGCMELVQDAALPAEGIGHSEQQSVIEELPIPGFLKNGLEENNTAEVYGYLAVNTFAEYVSGYLALIVVNGLSFLISFLLSTVLIRMLTYAFDIIARLPVIKGVNKMAGALVGIIKGVFFIWVAFLILTVLCSTEVGKTGLELVAKDSFLNFLYEKDFLIEIFMDIFYGN
ncbi:MAG: CvpA family protein [Eubacteriales bacterium]|nr:CvpA family protein [Eubacteriales bacterium]